MSDALRIELGPEAAGRRLDQVLAERLDRSRNQVQNELAAGRILLDGAAVRPSTRLAGGEVVTVEPAPPAEPELVGEELPLAVLDSDPDLLVLDKPAGIAVHPGAGRGRGTLSHRLIAHHPEIATIGHPRRPGIVHRLDIGTSGVMVVARSELAHRELVAAFAARRVAKEYLAVAHGRLPGALEIDRPIARHPTDRKRMSVRDGGRPARTECVRLDVAADERLSLVLVRLHTGRTHQIRVHLKEAGHPLVGDPTYGEARWKELRGPARTAAKTFPRPALHAWRLTLRHPRDGEIRSWAAPPPSDLAGLWEAVGGRPIDGLLAGLAPPSPGGDGPPAARGGRAAAGSAHSESSSV